MGKYDHNSQYDGPQRDDDFGKDSYYLRMIANELAELNRLKRLELHEMGANVDDLGDEA